MRHCTTQPQAHLILWWPHNTTHSSYQCLLWEMARGPPAWSVSSGVTQATSRVSLCIGNTEQRKHLLEAIASTGQTEGWWWEPAWECVKRDKIPMSVSWHHQRMVFRDHSALRDVALNNNKFLLCHIVVTNKDKGKSFHVASVWCSFLTPSVWQWMELNWSVWLPNVIKNSASHCSHFLITLKWGAQPPAPIWAPCNSMSPPPWLNL